MLNKVQVLVYFCESTKLVKIKIEKKRHITIKSLNLKDQPHKLAMYIRRWNKYNKLKPKCEEGVTS